MTWHVDTAVMERYLGGTLDRAAAASVETHVTGCPTCRALVPSEHDWLASSWADVLGHAVVPATSVSERVLQRCGVPGHLARVIAAPVVAGRAWLVATALALAFAVLAAHTAVGTTPQLWLLLTAPLAPVAGVAVTFGRRWSTVNEVEVAAPFDTFRLLLLRTSTVTSVAVALALVADLAAPSGPWVAAWLVPALALVLATLALGTRVALPVAAAITSVAWLSVVGSSSVAGDVLLLFGAAGQGGHVVVLLLATLVLARRSRAFDLGVLR